MPNASNTDRVRAAVGGEDVTEGRAVLAVQGPDARRRLRGRLPRGGGGGPVPGRRVRRGEARRARSPAPATRASTAWRSPCRPRRHPTCGVPCSRPGCSPRAWGPVTRCAWRPASRSTVTSWGRASRRCRPGWAGWCPGRSRRSGVGRRWRPRRSAGVARLLRGIATEGRRPPRAECPVVVGGQVAGETTSGNFSPGARPRHRPGLPAAGRRGRRRGGGRSPWHRPAGHRRRHAVRPLGLMTRERTDRGPPRAAGAGAGDRVRWGPARRPCLRTWPPPSRPVTAWSSCRRRARCCTCRPPTTRWPTRP